MAVLERSHKQKIISTSMVTMLFCGMALFSSLLISAASQLSTTAGSRQGSFGMVNLFELSKHAVQDGYQVSVRLYFGWLLVYVCFWLATGLLVAALRLRGQR